MTQARKASRPKTAPSLAYSVVFGLLIAVFAVLGHSYDVGDSFSWVTGHPLRALALFAIALIVATLLAEALFRLLDRSNGKHARAHRKSFSQALGQLLDRWSEHRTFLVCWLIVAVCWLPWFIALSPGATDSDTVTQLLQYFGLQESTDHHPWFDTLIFGAFWNLGNALGAGTTGLWVYVGVQALAIAAGASMLIVFCGRWQVKPLVRFVLLLLFAFYPPFPLFALCMMKDSLNAAFWLPWLVLFVDIVMTRGKSAKRPTVLIGFILLTVLCCLTKKTCAYIIAPSVIVALVACANHRGRIVIAGVISIACVLSWTYLALPAMGIPQDSSGEMLSVPSQQVARYARTYGVSEDEEAALSAVYEGGSEALAQGYVPRRADFTKELWRADSSFDDKMRFVDAYLTMFRTHPGVFFSATWNNVYDYFYPGRKLEMGIAPAYNDRYRTFWLSCCYDWVTEEQLDAFLEDSARQNARLTENTPVIYSAYKAVCQAPVVSILFSEALICSWIPLFFLLHAIRTRRGRALVICVPYALMLLSLVFGPISLIRYMAPVSVGVMVLLALLFTPRAKA